MYRYTQSIDLAQHAFLPCSARLLDDVAARWLIAAGPIG
jgi:hypothetical protein